MYWSLPLLLAALFNSPCSWASQHIHRSPLGTDAGVRVPRASNASGTFEVITSAWYPSWSSVRPAELSWDKYTHMVYSFGITTSDPSEITGIDQSLLEDFVRIARSKRVSPILALGGWTGSRFFSTIVATAESRTKFIKALLALVDKYDLDGIDFDWEYPGHQGLGCNAVDPDDSANFLSLLQELRKNRFNLELSTAVSTPFTGPDGNPMTDVSEFANVLDRVELMVYDTWSSKTNVGPNAPLRDDCAPSDFQFGSVHSIVDQWTQAKFPIEKLVLGLAAYGHSFTVSPSEAFDGPSRSLNMYPSIGGAQPAGSSDTPGDMSKDPCGNPYGLSGVFTFSGLVKTGFLDEQGNANHNYAIDSCSGTPFIYDEKSQVMVSYDDAKSFGLKGSYIADNNLAGFAVWDATGDYNDILLDSLHSAIGISACD